MHPTPASLESLLVQVSCRQGRHPCCHCMILHLVLHWLPRASQSQALCTFQGRFHHQIIPMPCPLVALQHLVPHRSHTRVFETVCLTMFRCGGALMTGHPLRLLRHCTTLAISTFTLPHSIQETCLRTCLRLRPPSRPLPATPHHRSTPLGIQAQLIQASACSSLLILSTQFFSSLRSHSCRQASPQTGQTTRTLVSRGPPFLPQLPATPIVFIQ